MMITTATLEKLFIIGRWKDRIISKYLMMHDFNHLSTINGNIHAFWNEFVVVSYFYFTLSFDRQIFKTGAASSTIIDEISFPRQEMLVETVQKSHAALRVIIGAK